MRADLRLTFLLCLAMLVSSCSVQINTVYDHTADFKAYKTYCWMDGCEFKISGPSYIKDSVLRNNVKKAMVSELNRKGLAQDTENPDLLIGFTIAMNDEKYIAYHPSAETPFYQPLENDSETIRYLKGTMVIGMADRKQSKIVWESFAVSYLDLNPDLSEAAVLKGIKLVLKNFPPQ